MLVARPWLGRSSALVVLISALCAPLVAEEGQYRSKILIDPDGTLAEGAALSVEALERQLGSITNPYAKATSSRHLARHFLSNKEYAKAVEYYRGDRGREGHTSSPPSELCVRFSRTQLSSRQFPYRDWLAATKVSCKVKSPC